jgi:NAD(P)-dependent dehydrogenase (short-subunit alcohol dehydrogenase family)
VSAPDLNRIALVTGAARGMGAAIADRLAAAGHIVVLADLDLEAAGATAAAIDSTDTRASAVAVDVADAASVAAMFAQVRRRVGSPDILVNNAGVISAAPFTELTEAAWDRVLDVNLKGQFLCARAALPAMRAQSWGRIINIASDAAKTGEPYIAHYAASKFGVIGLTQSLALEYAREGITVNAVCPAITDTSMMSALAEEMASIGVSAPDGGWRQAFVDEIPMGRAMRPEDVAEVCAFLAADAASAISGQAINVSGAHEMH